MFFYYCFSTKFGYDQVCWDQKQLGKPWDLIEANGSYFIVLGSGLSWQDLYVNPSFAFDIQNATIVETVLSKQTMELIHWMVYYYYTSYRSVIHLFLSDIRHYLKASVKAKTLTGKDLKKYSDYTSSSSFSRNASLSLVRDDTIKQTLVVFPDLLSLRHRTDDMDYILSSQDSIQRITKYYYDLQHGYKNILITTGANIFMDWKKLSQIILYFPETRYYKSQQNPRYYVPEVLGKMAELWKAKLVKIEV